MKLICLIYLCVYSASAFAWEYSEEVDAMTDEVKRSAFLTNSEGHKFSLYRTEPGGSVIANFRLSDDSFDQIDSEKLGLYRIDKLEPVNLVDSKRHSDFMVRTGSPSDATFDWTPKWVNFLFWHGKEDRGLGKVKQIMAGKKLVFRYYLTTGGAKDTTFNIENGTAEISKALQLSDKTAEERAAIELLQQRRLDFIKEGGADCLQKHQGDRTAFMECVKKVSRKAELLEQE